MTQLDDLCRRDLITPVQRSAGSNFALDWLVGRGTKRAGQFQGTKSLHTSGGYSDRAHAAERGRKALRAVADNHAGRESPGHMAVLIAASDLPLDEAARKCGLTEEDGLKELRYGLTTLAVFYRD